MNIFVLDLDPVQAAQFACDRHIVKMPSESAIMLGEPKGWSHHPCTKWARSSRSNYEWLKTHALALCEEYTYRYDRVHESEQVIRDADFDIPDHGLTPFVLAMPEMCKSDDPVESYRKYYCYFKHTFAAWTCRPIPDWFQIPFLGRFKVV